MTARRFLVATEDVDEAVRLVIDAAASVLDELEGDVFDAFTVAVGALLRPDERNAGELIAEAIAERQEHENAAADDEMLRRETTR